MFGQKRTVGDLVELTKLRTRRLKRGHHITGKTPRKCVELTKLRTRRLKRRWINTHPGTAHGMLN